MPIAQLSDCQVFYVDEGQGIPLVLIHGFPLDHSMWNLQVEGLKSSYRIIALDLPGFGASTPHSGQMSIIGFADRLMEFLDALNLPQVTLCGLSMGGSIALQFALRHPERLSKLILCDCRAATDTPEAQRMRHELAERVLREGPECVAQAMPARLFSPHTIESQPEIVQSVQNVIRANPRESIAGGSRALADREDVFSRLSMIKVSTLLIVGVDDVISTVSEMRSMANQIPNSQLVEIEQAGHMAPLENAQAVNQAIRIWMS